MEARRRESCGPEIAGRRRRTRTGCAARYRPSPPWTRRSDRSLGNAISHAKTAKTQSEAAFKIVMERGQTYYIECGLVVVSGTGRPSFRLATKEDALKSMSKIDLAAYDKTPFVVSKASPKDDTIRALQNLYRRKRVGGTVRSIVFGVLAVSALVNTVNYKSTSVTVNGGSQTIPIDDSPPPGNYIGIGIFTIFTITGFTQIANHTQDKLDALLADYKNGIPLPKKIKSKLKQKDFKATN